MGTTNPAASILMLRQSVPLEYVFERYNIPFDQSDHGDCLRARCPLPMHPKHNRGKTLRAYQNHFWKCLSRTCTENRKPLPKNDVVAFVALMENCSVAEAAEKLNGWLAERPL